MSTSSVDHLQKFKEASEAVYGPLKLDEASLWSPPERSGGHRGRYLWTDAFGVLNFITLSKETKNEAYLVHATRLVDTVHNVLGRTRDGRARLPRATTENPLAGGLRIGKEDEGGVDGDGQYHHYLTLWMFALNRVAKATGESKYNDQAIALAKAIHPNFFINRQSTQPRMVWKISVDMSEVLVPSQGNLDPLDGYMVFSMLQSASKKPKVLVDEIADYKRIIDIKGSHHVSSDTLDLGMTMWTAHWLENRDRYFQNLAKQARVQVHKLAAQNYLSRPMQRRLAFREYGTCLGIGCTQESDETMQAFRNDLIDQWENYRDKTPDDLRAISEVMRAAALIPGAFKIGYLDEEELD